MNVSLVFTRIFFTIVSIFFMTTYMVSRAAGDHMTNVIVGVVAGIVLMVVLIGFDILLKRFNLRSFNIVVIGLFFGYLMGEALVLILGAVLDISKASVALSPQVIEMIKIALFLFGIYLGTILTLRSSDELYISVPFVKFSPTAQKKKDLIVDASVLSDARILDMCATGLLDQHVVIPRFIIKDLYAKLETGDEATKIKSKRSLDVIKKMEELPGLAVRFNDTDFPEVKDIQSKLIRLARLTDSNMLTADISRVQMATIEGILIINLHTLSNALKPLMQTGELIKIKVQRYGKEPRQGVGYLEDGTMVVINGGGNYIGETIDAQVLSVKHTSSGRMIFCNALDEFGKASDIEDDEYFDGDE